MFLFSVMGLCEPGMFYRGDWVVLSLIYVRLRNCSDFSGFVRLIFYLIPSFFSPVDGHCSRGFFSQNTIQAAGCEIDVYMLSVPNHWDREV